MRIPTCILLASALAGCSTSATENEPQEVAGIPTTAPELFQWLEAGEYRSFAKESSAHPSAGPHPVTVLAYLNDILDGSLGAGSSRHPVGAAAVKELYSSSGSLQGWAVMVKIRDDRTDGAAWYWYEVTSRDAAKASDPDFAGVGLSLCAGCHSAGRDFIRIEYPLR